MEQPFRFEAGPFETNSELLNESWELNPEFFEEEWQGEMNRNSPEFVKWVQDSLNKIMGLRLAVDGVMGPMTRSAVRSFQQKQGLSTDGIVGTLTENALREVLQQTGGAPTSTGYTPSSTRRVFEDAVTRNDWRNAFLNLNGLDMYEILRALDGLSPDRRDSLKRNRQRFRGIVDMPRIEFALFVVENRQLPMFAPYRLPNDQILTAQEFLQLSNPEIEEEVVDWLKKTLGLVPKEPAKKIMPYVVPRLIKLMKHYQLAMEEVRWIQTILNKTMGENLKVDGFWGPKTREAVRRFQSRYGLQADGVVGFQTRTALIQSGLNWIEQRSVLPINGVLDTQTKAAIVRFQGRSNLKADGIVGPKTRAAMVYALNLGS